MQMEAGSAGVVFHKEVLESAIATTAGGVLVSQHYWDPSDATYTNEDGEEVDKYITAEFLHSKEYGCQVPHPFPVQGCLRHLSCVGYP